MADTTPTPEVGRILRLEISNVMRLQGVEIEPDGSLVIVAGKNDQGKSSVLAAIRFALGGRAAMKDVPEIVREGQEAARVLAEFEDLTILRTITGGRDAVKVQAKDGKTFSSPQTMLNKLLTSLTFNPLAFAQLDAGKQRQVLLGLVDLGIDLDQVDTDIKNAYELRREVGRDVTKLENALKVAPEIPKGTPAEEVRSADILAELEEAQTANRRVIELNSSIEQRTETIGKLDARIAEIRHQLAQAEALVDQHRVQLEADRELRATKTLVDESPLRERLSSVDATNAHVRNRQQKSKLDAQLTVHRDKQQSYTDRIEELNASKTEALAGAKMPIEGLGFTDDAVTFNGLPLQQISESGRVKVSAAVQMALNPDCKIMLIDNGNALDEDNLALLDQMATEAGHQIWMTWVGQSELATVVIEDGQVVGAAS